MDPYQNFLARALPSNARDNENDLEDAAAAPDHAAEGEQSPPADQRQDTIIASPSAPPCNPQLEDRITKAITTARRAFKSQKKQLATKDLEFIRADLNSACAAAEDVMNSWPSLKIPDSSSEDLHEWPTPAPEYKPNPPGVIHPAPSARVFRGSRLDITSINGRSVEAPVWILPTHSRVPPYKSWSGLRRNQISIETGQKMFYTEADTGETIPLSDDEGVFTTEQHDSKVLEGLRREETNAILIDVLQQLRQQKEENEGEGRESEYKEKDVLEMLAWQLGISLEAMENRINELKGKQDAQQQQHQVNAWEEKYDFETLDKDFHAAFCRLCRKYGCRVHTGDHPRPVYGPMSLGEEKEREKDAKRRYNGRWRNPQVNYEDIVIAEREPCGHQCYKLLLSAQELEDEAREAAAAAVQVEEEEEEEEEDDVDDNDDEEEEEKVQEEEEQAAPWDGATADFIDLVEYNDDGVEVINLVTSEEEEEQVLETGGAPMETDNKEIEELEIKESGAGGGAAAALEYDEVTSPVKKSPMEMDSVPEPPLQRLPALDAVLKGNAAAAAVVGGGDGSGAASALIQNLELAQKAFQTESKTQAAAKAAAAQAAPLSPSKSRQPSPTNSGNNNNNKPGDAAAATVLADVADISLPLPAAQELPSEIVPSTSNANVINEDTNANASQKEKQDQQQKYNLQDDSAWELWEENALEKGIEIWGKQPCKLAALIGSRSCSQVRARLMNTMTNPLSNTHLKNTDTAGLHGDTNQHRSSLDAPFNNEVMPPYRRKRKGGKNAQPSVVYQRFKRSPEEAWPQYHPCGCQGPCKETCPCRGDANFCEKYCGCDPEWCGNRFQGCQCKCGTIPGKRCTTRQCPCLAAGRECDPDLCKLCIPTLHNTNEPGHQCNNFRLQLRQKRRVLMGLSDVIGWGAFLAGPAVKKDEFIGEYCGELIDQQEADRRGKVYDRDDNSYLFNLNEQWVIDARQKGNKLRFANHSTTANCRAEILVVDGDHRVAIMANKDLLPGEELFYDYRYDLGVAPDWAQGRGGRGGGGDGGASGSGRGRGRGRGR